MIGGDKDNIYLVIADLGSKSGEGLDFINGMTWIERFYVALGMLLLSYHRRVNTLLMGGSDTTNQKVGIANTPFTRATTN